MPNAVLPLLIAFTHRESQQHPLAQQSVPPTDLAFGLAQELDSEKLHNFVVTFQDNITVDKFRLRLKGYETNLAYHG